MVSALKYLQNLFSESDFWGLIGLYVLISNLLILFNFFFKNYLQKKILTHSLNSSWNKVHLINLILQTNLLSIITYIISLDLMLRFVKSFPIGYKRIDSLIIIVLDISIIYVITLAIYKFLIAGKIYLKSYSQYKNKPIDSYFQVFVIVLWAFSIMMILSQILYINYKYFLTFFGTASAIIIIVFKDPIMGFVASIQLSFENIVEIGDWISFPKHDADGFIVEINLSTVKIKNWDNSYTIISTYCLVSESFKNWKGMMNSSGRRLKRHLIFKSTCVRFLEKKDIEKLSKISLLEGYLEEFKNFNDSDINNYYNKNEQTPDINPMLYSWTNLGAFRYYANKYIEIHPKTVYDEVCDIRMCRYLQPTPQGIPFEVYTFISEKDVVEFEEVASTIFDNLISIIGYFDLELANVNMLIAGDNDNNKI